MIETAKNVYDVGDSFACKAPRTKEELAVYCATVFNNRVPYPAHCEEHQSILDAVWSAYAEIDDFLIWYAMRGTGKTWTLSILSWLESVFKKNCGTTVLGGSLEQSQKAVAYLDLLWSFPNVPAHMLVNGQVAGRGFRLTNGSWVTALAASPKSVRGPHPQKLRLDECLTGDTIIKTIKGPKKIKDISEGDIIFGWNGIKIIHDMVQYKCCVGKRQTYKIYFSNGNFINCTSNHKILTTKGYLYLDEIKRRKCECKTTFVIGERKKLSKMWKKIKFKKKIHDWILSRMLYQIKCKTKKILYFLRKKSRSKFDILSGLLCKIKKIKKIKMYRLWKRIKATRHNKMQTMLFKTFIKSGNGGGTCNSFVKKSIKGRIKHARIITKIQYILSISSTIRKICIRFFNRRFKTCYRSTWRILARQTEINRKRQKKKRIFTKTRLLCNGIKNKIYALMGFRNYGIYEVTKIEKDSINEVYDLKIYNFSSFMANGIIVHNCDEMDKTIYEAALGQPKANHGISDNIVISSTLHHAFGLMSEIIDDREKIGAKLYQWCYKDMLKPYGFWTFDELMRRRRQISQAMWDAEYALKRPKLGDTIFEWQTVENSFRRGIKDKFDRDVYLNEAGIDWGHTCTVLNIIQDNKERYKCVESYSWEYRELVERCEEIADICEDRRIKVIYCDSNPKDAGLTLINVLRKKRIPTQVIPVAFNKWKDVSINVIRYLLERNLLDITDKTLQEKLKKFHYKNVDLEQIDKVDDHYPDALIAWASSRWKILNIPNKKKGA